MTVRAKDKKDLGFFNLKNLEKSIASILELL